MDYYLQPAFASPNYIEAKIADELRQKHVYCTSRDITQSSHDSEQYVHVAAETFRALAKEEKFSHWGDYNGHLYGLFKEGSHSATPSGSPPKNAPVTSAVAETNKATKPKKTVHISDPKDDILASSSTDAGHQTSHFEERRNTGTHASIHPFVNRGASNPDLFVTHTSPNGSLASGKAGEDPFHRTLTIRGAILLEQPLVTPAELPIIEAEIKRLATISKKSRSMYISNSVAPAEVPLLEAHVRKVEQDRLKFEDLDRVAREQELGPLPSGWRMMHSEDGEEYYVKFASIPKRVLSSLMSIQRQHASDNLAGPPHC